MLILCFPKTSSSRNLCGSPPALFPRVSSNLAPFDPDHLSRPTTYLALLVPLYLALTEPDEERFLFHPDDTISRNEMAVGYFGLHEMVAVGEESFFRGVLNNGLSDGFGDNWGLASSSVLFGLAHSGTGGQATSVGAALFGAYLGYLQQQNGYLIGQGVAIHFWWNFLITVGMLHERTPEQTIPIFTFYTRF